MNLKESERQKVIDSVTSINKGPRMLNLYMEICAKCGTCASQCHITLSDPSVHTNPALRSDHLRKIYKRYGTLSGKVLGSLMPNGDPDIDIDRWAKDFYDCTGCRRCAQYCPFGIDNSIMTRKGRAIVHSLGKTPFKIAETQRISDECGNDEGIPFEAFKENVKFLEEEMKDETGVDVKIPVGKEKADVLFVPASADLISFPDTQIGSAKIMHVAGLDWTMDDVAIDAANFGLFSGDDAHMKRKNKLIHDAAIKRKVKTVIIGECGHAFRVMRMAPNFFGKENVPYKIINILELAADLLRQGKMDLDKTKNPEPVAYHDPCNFARSCGITEEPRELMRASCMDYREMTPNREYNWCCGGGGGLAVMDSAEDVELMKEQKMTYEKWRVSVNGLTKLEQVKRTGTKYLAAPCSNCKRQLTQLMEYHKTGIQVGGVVDLISNAIRITK